MKLKSKELRLMSKEELETKEEELRKDLLKLNIQVAAGTTLKSPGKARQLKKTLARISALAQAKKGSVETLAIYGK